MATMKAAVARKLGQPLTIEDVPVPSPGPGEVLVKIMASGVCHTDLHAADGDWPVKPTLPFVPGHEGAGIVAGLGAGVRHLKEGDPVGIAGGDGTVYPEVLDKLTGHPVPAPVPPAEGDPPAAPSQEPRTARALLAP